MAKIWRFRGMCFFMMMFFVFVIEILYLCADNPSQKEYENKAGISEHIKRAL